MKKFNLVFIVFILLISWGCEEKITEPKSTEKIKILTNGIWEIAADTEVGEVGAQLKYYSDGRAQVRASDTSGWYNEYLQWSMTNDGTEITLNGTDGPGTQDVLQILELTNTHFRGKIISSTSSEAIGKVSKMFNVAE
ncbi:MAG: hypothetical protein KF721_13075 [Ignavibacteriaceae bacterium]|nr:hypothetical protein [Ignavibacteriaceae bacterium]